MWPHDCDICFPVQTNVLLKGVYGPVKWLPSRVHWRLRLHFTALCVQSNEKLWKCGMPLYWMNMWDIWTVWLMGPGTKQPLLKHFLACLSPGGQCIHVYSSPNLHMKQTRVVLNTIDKAVGESTTSRIELDCLAKAVYSLMRGRFHCLWFRPCVYIQTSELISIQSGTEVLIY